MGALRRVLQPEQDGPVCASDKEEEPDLGYCVLVLALHTSPLTDGP